MECGIKVRVEKNRTLTPYANFLEMIGIDFAFNPSAVLQYQQMLNDWLRPVEQQEKQRIRKKLL